MWNKENTKLGALTTHEYVYETKKKWKQEIELNRRMVEWTHEKENQPTTS